MIPSRKAPTIKRPRRERIQMMRKEGMRVFFMIFLTVYGNLIVGVLYLYNPQWIFWAYLGLPLELRMVGLVLGIVSVPYAYWVGQTLANLYSFTVEVQKEHKLITTGPYKRVRHPLYAATLLFLIGQALISDNWLFLVIVLATVPGFIVRIEKEEGMMIEEFGDEYRDYMKRTGRLLPRFSSRNGDS
ncbi:MAG: isoprenylcysteine carboxylmethyltransferase family protein [Candidatus Bathyarchaeota archaeon]|nr:MAG: isoprenylcysteine carboxylmethyltransferase family protein [Candidatus Bathyarchaeota archaeon]